jgi:hypothetical protein
MHEKKKRDRDEQEDRENIAPMDRKEIMLSHAPTASTTLGK